MALTGNATEIDEKAAQAARMETVSAEAEEALLRSRISEIVTSARKYIKSRGIGERGETVSFTLETVSDFFLSYVPLVEHKNCPTMATDYKKIMYSTKFIARLYDEIICGHMHRIASLQYSETKKEIEAVIGDALGKPLNDEERKTFWEDIKKNTGKIYEAKNGSSDPKNRRMCWFFALAKLEGYVVRPDDAMKLAGELSEKFLKGRDNLVNSVTVEFREMVAGIFLHEVLHIIRGDVASEDKKRQEYVWKSSPLGPGKDDAAGGELHQMLNRAMDAVINDTIENELLGKKVLPVWTVRKDNARKLETRAIYTDTVTRSCEKMAASLGKELAATENIVEMERKFRELYWDSMRALDEKISEMAGQSRAQKSKGQEGEGQEEGQPGKEKENGQGSSNNKQGKGKKKGVGRSTDKGTGGSGIGDLNPKKHIHNAIAEVFGGEKVSDLEPQIVVMTSADGMESQGGGGVGKPQDWNEYPGKPIDDHGTCDEEIEKEEERTGERPGGGKENEALKQVAREHLEKSATRRAGKDSALAEILVAIGEADDIPPPSFRDRIIKALHSIFSPIPKKTYEKFPRNYHGIAPQFSRYGKGVILPTYKNPRNRGHILIAIDVSGSMGNEDVRAAVIETLGLLNSIGPGHRISVVQIDAGIVDWTEFKTGSQRCEAYKDEIESSGFKRGGCGGTVYEDLFELLAGSESRKRTEFSKTLPEEFPGKDYGVPARVDKPDTVLFFTDWGFSDTDLATLKKTNLFWIGVTDRPEYAEPRQGVVIDCDELAVNRMERVPGM